jgi:putative addiction module component (TIGR02574 family)
MKLRRLAWCSADLARHTGEVENTAMERAAVNLDDLSPEEQLQLLEELWDRLSRQPANLPLSPEQREELDRRLDALEEDVRAGRTLGRPWSEVRDHLRSR